MHTSRKIASKKKNGDVTTSHHHSSYSQGYDAADVPSKATQKPEQLQWYSLNPCSHKLTKNFSFISKK